MLKTVLAAALAITAVAEANAQASQSVSAADLQLVVFNRPGAKWADRASATPLLLAHRDLYREMARTGEIVISGRFTGEPLLGMSLFAKGADQADIRRRLEADPAVTGGYIALEFRTLARSFTEVQAGAKGQP